MQQARGIYLTRIALVVGIKRGWFECDAHLRARAGFSMRYPGDSFPKQGLMKYLFGFTFVIEEISV